MLLDAEMLHIPYTNGLPMLVAQAKYANDLFLDAETSDERIEPVLKAMRRSMMNITFVGMPGSGKTTVGRLTAQLLGREFVDIDEQIERQTEMTIEKS
jgi:shikimate dehydrogenase